MNCQLPKEILSFSVVCYRDALRQKFLCYRENRSTPPTDYESDPTLDLGFCAPLSPGIAPPTRTARL